MRASASGRAARRLVAAAAVVLALATVAAGVALGFAGPVRALPPAQPGAARPPGKSALFLLVEDKPRSSGRPPSGNRRRGQRVRGVPRGPLGARTSRALRPGRRRPDPPVDGDAGTTRASGSTSTRTGRTSSTSRPPRAAAARLQHDRPHPPLYHPIAAAVVAVGLDAGALGWMAALWGMLRLVLIWVGLERWLPESRLARVVALALAAVVPAAAHLDGMITNETLVMLLSAAVLVVAPSAIAAARTGRVGPMVGLALLLGLALMAKVSASVLRDSVAVAIGLEIAHAGRRRRGAGAARPGAAADRRCAGAGRHRGAVVRAQPGPLRADGAQRLRGIAEAEPGAIRGDAVLRSPAARLLRGLELRHLRSPDLSDRHQAERAVLPRAARDHVQRLLRLQLLGRRPVREAIAGCRRRA